MKEIEDSGYGLVGLDGHGRRPHKTDPEDAPEIKWCWWLWQQTCRKDNLTPPRCLEWPHEFSQRCAWSLRGQTLNHWRELKLIFSIKGTFSPTGWKEPQPSFSLFFFIWVFWETDAHWDKLHDLYPEISFPLYETNSYREEATREKVLVWQKKDQDS